MPVFLLKPYNFAAAIYWTLIPSFGFRVCQCQDALGEKVEQATTAWLERSMVLKIVARLPHCDFNIPFSFYKLVF